MPNEVYTLRVPSARGKSGDFKVPFPAGAVISSMKNPLSLHEAHPMDGRNSVVPPAEDSRISTFRTDSTAQRASLEVSLPQNHPDPFSLDIIPLVMMSTEPGFALWAVSVHHPHPLTTFTL